MNFNIDGNQNNGIDFDKEDDKNTDMDQKSVHDYQDQHDPTSIDFATPHYSVSFKGETITEYKISNKHSDNVSERQPVDSFVQEMRGHDSYGG